jgi:hypothetical protein
VLTVFNWRWGLKWTLNLEGCCRFLVSNVHFLRYLLSACHLLAPHCYTRNCRFLSWVNSSKYYQFFLSQCSTIQQIEWMCITKKTNMKSHFTLCFLKTKHWVREVIIIMKCSVILEFYSLPLDRQADNIDQIGEGLEMQILSENLSAYLKFRS